MIETTDEVRKDKDTSREFEQNYLSSVKEFHRGGVLNITSDENSGITMVEAWSEVTFQDGKRLKLEETARQKWQGDQNIGERFYYNPGPMGD